LPTHLLDTSVYSQPLKPWPLPGVVDRWRALGDASLAISSISEAELLFGLHKRNSTRLWTEYRARLENKLPILVVDKAVGDCFGKLKALMTEQGTPRSDFDLMIAATAIRHRLVLATLNARHFIGLPGLDVEVWEDAGPKPS
jgi:predicted nucleic acid-binding protein